MNEFIKLGAAITVALALSTSAQAASIGNGSFEVPPAPDGSFDTYSGGSTGITDWTVVGSNSSIVSTTFVSNGITFQAQQGNQWLDLTGPGTNDPLNGVTQDVATTIGTLYNLSFWVGSATDFRVYFASTVDLSIEGGPRVSYTNLTAPGDRLDWQLFTVSFAAVDTSTTITFYNGSGAGNNLSAIDNVSITGAIPEPETYAMLLAGLGLLGFAARRRKQQAA